MTGRPSGPRLPETALAALACAALSALLFAPALFGGRSTLSFPLGDPRVDVRPWSATAPTDPGQAINPITPDVDLYVLPGLVRVQQLRAEGASDGWEPLQLLGVPLAANMPLPLRQPLVALASRLPPVDALDVLLWGHVALAALLAFRAARVLGTGRAEAAFAAVGFSLSAWMTTRWHLPHILYATAFWPGLLGAWGWLLRGRPARAAFEGGLCLGLSLLSFPQVGTVLFAGCALLVLSTRATRTRAGLAALAATGILGGALAAPQLVASGGAYAQSLRGSPETRAATARQGLVPGALFGLVLPEFFGRPSDYARPDPPAPTMQSDWPTRHLLSDDPQDNVVENALYPGALVLLLLTLLARRGTCGKGRRLAALGALALLVALAWPPLARAFPGLAALGAGNPKRLLVLVDACWPFAGAFALWSLRQGASAAGGAAGRESARTAGGAPAVAGRCAWWRTPTGSITLVALGWVAFVALVPVALRAWGGEEVGGFVVRVQGQALRAGGLLLAGAAGLLLARRSAGLAVLPAVLLAIDLAPLGLAFNPFPPQAPPFPPTPAIEALAARPGRVADFGAPNLLPPSAAATRGIRGLQGVAALVPRRTAELLGCLEGPLFDPRDPRVASPLRDPASLTHPLLDLLGVATVVHADPALAATTGLPTLFAHPEEALGALERPGAGPLAFFCGGAEVVSDPAERLARLADRSRDVHAAVLLERPPRTELPALGAFRPLVAEAQRADRRLYRTDGSEPGIAVLVESWDPGWSVTVDGRPAEVLVVDHALPGVELSAGPHELEWRYAIPHERLASGLGSLGWVVLGLLAIGIRRGERQAAGASR